MKAKQSCCKQKNIISEYKDWTCYAIYAIKMNYKFGFIHTWS